MIITTDKQLEKRKEQDYYPTPIELAVGALGMLPKEFVPEFVLDPGAGDGVWGRAFRQIYGDKPWLHGIEIRPIFIPEVYHSWEVKNYLTDGDIVPRIKDYDLIMGNPPFKFAEEFIDKSFELVKDGGYILFLFRLAFLESKKRYERYYNNGYNPKKVGVSVNRISFRGTNTSDDTAYAMYLWQKGYVGDTILTWLNWR